MPRAQQIHMVPLQTMVDGSIEFIRANEPVEGFYVAFSGGKDSQVLLELTRMAGVKYSAYYAMALDPPELRQFIRKYYPEVKWLRPKMSFYEGIRHKFPPTFHHRWCCDVLKKDPTAHIQLRTRLVGVRAEESAKRSKLGKVTEFRKWHMLRPIFGWREWHIWDFIHERGLPYCELYEEFDRIGCVVCPMMASKNMRKIDHHRRRWPSYYKAFEHSVRWWFENKAGDDKSRCTTADEYLDAWYKGFPEKE